MSTKAQEKNNGNNTLTYIRKEIAKVKKELQKSATKEELNKMRDDLKKFRLEVKNNFNKYATSEELHNGFKELIEFIRITNDQTKKELRDEMQKMRKELRNEIVQFKDDILHEIIKLREDNIVTVGYRDQIEDHEVRINKLEKTPPHN